MPYLFETAPEFKLNEYATAVAENSRKSLIAISQDALGDESFQFAACFSKKYLETKEFWLHTKQHEDGEEEAFQAYESSRSDLAKSVARLLRNNSLKGAESKLSLMLADLSAVGPDTETAQLGMWAKKLYDLIVAIESLTDGSWEKMANALLDAQTLFKGFAQNNTITLLM